MSDQATVVAEETTENVAEVEQTAVAEQAQSPESVSEASESPNGLSTPASQENQESAAETEEVSDEESGQVSIHNLKSGQKLVGTVKNIAGFGAFVNIGLPQDGLVHISELSKQKVENVTDVVSPGQEIDVWIKKVDKKRGRISLTMIKPVTRKFKSIREDDELSGIITRLESYGAFVDIDSDREGLVHISQVTHDYVNHPEEALTIGDTVQVKVLKVNRKKRQIDLSIKALLSPPAPTEAEIAAQSVEAEAASDEAAEPVPTAMALAFASFQNEKQADDSDQAQEGPVSKRRREMDDIVARTVAAQQDL